MLEGHLRAKEVFYDPPASLPYRERIGHRLARDQETLTWRIWTDYVREDLKDKNIQKLTRLVKRPKNQTKRKSGRVLFEPHRRPSRRKRRRKKIINVGSCIAKRSRPSTSGFRTSLWLDAALDNKLVPSVRISWIKWHVRNFGLTSSTAKTQLAVITHKL